MSTLRLGKSWVNKICREKLSTFLSEPYGSFSNHPSTAGAVRALPDPSDSADEVKGPQTGAWHSDLSSCSLACLLSILMLTEETIALLRGMDPRCDLIILLLLELLTRGADG